MKTFVKIKDYPNWFLLIRTQEEITDYLIKSGYERLVKTVGDEILKDNYDPQTFMARFQLVSNNPPDYRGVLAKYGQPLLIRPIGSYMFLSEGYEITETVFSDYFPTKPADIVICENSKDAEPKWIEYLNKRFTNKTIKVVNFFGTRSVEEIENEFEGATHITFSTTFTKVEWYVKLLRAAGKKPVIGYCHDESKWVEVPQPNNLEIVLKFLR